MGKASAEGWFGPAGAAAQPRLGWRSPPTGLWPALRGPNQPPLPLLWAQKIENNR